VAVVNVQELPAGVSGRMSNLGRLPALDSVHELVPMSQNNDQTPGERMTNNRG